MNAQQTSVASGTDPLVTPTWLENRLETAESDDAELRLVEVDLNTEFYEQAHIPGAVCIDWRRELQHETRRDIPSKAAFAELLGTRGATENSTLVVYGDNSNWFAAHFYWMLKYYGHDDVYLLDGGRRHWVESGRPTSDSVPSYRRCRTGRPVRSNRSGPIAAVSSERCRSRLPSSTFGYPVSTTGPSSHRPI